MNIGVAGLGLIGGSFAKAYKKDGHKIYVRDIDENVIRFSMIAGVSDEELTTRNVSLCDVVFVCTYPEAALKFMEDFGPFFSKDSVVIDCCGTKEVIVEKGMEIARKYGFTYAGGHPMAGTQYSGFKYSKENLFKGAPMVIVPERYDDIELLDRIKALLEPAGFGKISVTTAKRHDELIAFTSQLAHIVSNAYVKSPTAKKHKGFSAGSYKDLTRVAWLNPVMWSELFLENKDNLLKELDILIDNLSEYREAIKDDDRECLEKLLEEGRDIKAEIDG